VEPGQRLGDYEIIQELTEGGMARVYLARNVQHHELQVVLKILKDADHSERFREEAATLYRMDHPNISQLTSFFESREGLVIVMRYVEGISLAEYARQSKDRDFAAIKSYFLQILTGLSYAHSKGIYHRDIKPSNVMINKEGVVKIIDFGIARRSDEPRKTRTGTSVGTPRYMAPEQFSGEKIDDYTLCDIYSTGISLYELCCGRVPFEDSNEWVLITRHCTEPPTPPRKLDRTITPEFERIILKALDKDPKKRFQSAEDMRKAIETTSPRFDDPAETKWGFWSKARAWGVPRSAAMIAVPLLGIAAILVLAVLGHNNPTEVRAVHFPPQEIVPSKLGSSIDLVPFASFQGERQPVRWECGGTRHLRLAVTSNGRLSVSGVQDGWTGRDTAFIVAMYSDSSRDSGDVIFVVPRRNSAPRIVGRISQSRPQGEAFAEVHLVDLVTDTDQPASTIKWSTPESGNFDASLAGGVARISPKSPSFVGRDSVLFVASDDSGAADSTYGVFEVTQTKTQVRNLTIRTLPDRCRIVAPFGQEHGGTFYAKLPEGKYTFTLYHRDFPIQTATFSLNSSDIDTTLNLEEDTDYSGVGRLAVGVWYGPTDVVSRELIINKSRTGQMSMDSIRTMLAGDYDVRVALEKGAKEDSVIVNLRDKYRDYPRISVTRNDTSRIDIYVTGAAK